MTDSDSSSDATALSVPEAPRSGRNALLQVGRQVRYGTMLTPWMLAYAEWLILECIEPPKISARTTRARGLARAPVASHHLKLLEARDDFVDYCDELRKGPLERARARFQQAFPTYIEAHATALTLATEAKDYKAMASIAEPVLDRVIPKKSDVIAAPVVHITLTPQQMQGVASYVAPVLTVDDADIEVVPE